MSSRGKDWTLGGESTRKRPAKSKQIGPTPFSETSRQPQQQSFAASVPSHSFVPIKNNSLLFQILEYTADMSAHQRRPSMVCHRMATAARAQLAAFWRNNPDFKAELTCLFLLGREPDTRANPGAQGGLQCLCKSSSQKGQKLRNRLGIGY
jgi:hypothetical protein